MNSLINKLKLLGVTVSENTWRINPNHTWWRFSIGLPSNKPLDMQFTNTEMFNPEFKILDIHVKCTGANSFWGYDSRYFIKLEQLDEYIDVLFDHLHDIDYISIVTFEAK